AFPSTSLVGVAADSASSASDRPAIFAVRNIDAYGGPCKADNAAYRVAGRLLMPAGPAPKSVTVYVHGSGGGQYWHQQALPGYDYVTEMARLGHASLSLNNLGYGASDIPPG